MRKTWCGGFTLLLRCIAATAFAIAQWRPTATVTYSAGLTLAFRHGIGARSEKRAAIISLHRNVNTGLEMMCTIRSIAVSHRIVAISCHSPDIVPPP